MVTVRKLLAGPRFPIGCHSTTCTYNVITLRLLYHLLTRPRFDANRANMQASCAQWGVPNDSDDEIADMMDAILDIALATGVDARFILVSN